MLDEAIRQDIHDIKTSVSVIQRDISDIKVELGEHRQKFNWVNDKTESLRKRVDKTEIGTAEAKKEVKDMRMWIMSAVITGLISLIGIMVSAITWIIGKFQGKV